jgi:menaquinone-dependent protoporphyrinogen oxidase
MSILVAYSSKHGATQEIADRIAAKLRATGRKADSQPLKSARDLSGYDAFVIGSAVYFGKWMKDAVTFVRHNQEILAAKPIWLFSSGPLGTETTDAKGHDLRDAAEPKELDELFEAVHPRDHRVFFGALDAGKLGFAERAIHALPAGKELLRDGDFRDWDEIETWADEISRNLDSVVSRRR